MKEESWLEKKNYFLSSSKWIKSLIIIKKNKIKATGGSDVGVGIKEVTLKPY